MKRSAIAAIVTLSATVAHANSRLPEANQLVIAPDDPTSMLLRSTFGFLFSKDAGKTWDWLCESAIPCAGQQDPAVALMNGGRVLSGQIEGLATSPDHGCSWSFVSGTEKIITSDVARTPDGATAIAITSTYSKVTNDAGVPLYNSQILETIDTAKSWQPLSGVIDPMLVIDTLDIAPSDSSRIYISGQIFGANHGAMLVSKDGGMSYSEYPIPFVAGETGAYISGVDPANADRVYVRTLGLTASVAVSRLLVSSDGGQTFTEHWSGGKMLGFALSQDGSRVYVGSITDGLLAGSASDLVFTQKSATQIECLATSGATLFVCGNEANSGFILGATLDEGTTFSPLLRLETVHQPLDCAATTNAAQCLTQWPALEEQLGIDGGALPGSEPNVPSSHCGCESSEPRGRDALFFAAMAAFVIKLRSRLFRAAR